MKHLSFFTIYTCSIVLTPFVPSTHAWAVTFYSGQNCNEDSKFNNILYQGSGSKGHNACFYAGAPADSVTCDSYINNDAEHLSCLGYVSPSPQSAYFPCGTLCGFGFDSTCKTNAYEFHNQQRLNLTVLSRTLRAEGDTRELVTFNCFDGGSIWDESIGCSIANE